MNKTTATEDSLSTRDSMRWWIKLFLQPLLLLIFLVTTFFVLGVLQQMGLLKDATTTLVTDLEASTMIRKRHVCSRKCRQDTKKPPTALKG